MTLTPNDFWEEIAEDSPDIEGLIWKKKTGEWVMLATDPATGKVASVRVYYNPWTGEGLT